MKRAVVCGAGGFIGSHLVSLGLSAVVGQTRSRGLEQSQALRCVLPRIPQGGER
jgi:hypothetical protein